MEEPAPVKQPTEPSWCVLGRRKQEYGSWSWFTVIKAWSAQEALDKAMRRGRIHGYYVALPWEVAARAKTKLYLLDPEGNPP